MIFKLIEDDKQVYEYISEICPSKGDVVKRLCFVLTSWEVMRVTHLIDLIERRDKESIIILRVKEIKGN